MKLITHMHLNTWMNFCSWMEFHTTNEIWQIENHEQMHGQQKISHG